MGSCGSGRNCCALAIEKVLYMVKLLDVILGVFPLGAGKLIQVTQEAKKFKRSIDRNWHGAFDNFGPILLPRASLSERDVCYCLVDLLH